MTSAVCSKCGFTNRAEAQFCTQCGTLLSPGAAEAVSFSDRPGCVTIYAIVLFVGAVVNGVTAVQYLDATETLLVGLILLGLAITGIAVAFGLFRQKKWARIGVILLMCVSIVLLALQVFAGVLDAPFGLVGVAIPIFIIWWFATNKQYFA